MIKCRRYGRHAPMTILIISGLPLKRKTSFLYQSLLLREAFEQNKIKTILAGPEGYGEEQGKLSVLPLWAGNKKGGTTGYSLHELINTTGSDAVILLGLAEQFPFLKESNNPGVPVFLWAQLSHPVEPMLLGDAIPVPLTEKTEEFLRKSVVEKIGPVIPHGVDTQVFRPQGELRHPALQEDGALPEQLRQTRRFVIGTVGANNPRKRYSLIFESFSLFSRAATDACMLIKTDQAKKPGGYNLYKLAKEYEIHDRVSILEGDISSNKLASLYRQMDLFVTLSEWEGFCIPVIEAMACGVPVIAPPIQGPGEIVPYKELILSGGSFIKGGKTVLYEANQQEVSQMFLKAFRSPDMLARLTRIGINEVKKRFDIRIVVKKWIELIQGESF